MKILFKEKFAELQKLQPSKFSGYNYMHGS